jgi:hypothetical protein
MQTLRSGRYELGVHALPGLTVAAALDELHEWSDTRSRSTPAHRYPAAINAAPPLELGGHYILVDPRMTASLGATAEAMAAHVGCAGRYLRRRAVEGSGSGR